MEKEQLIQSLEQLHAELETTADLDETTRQHLAELADEIKAFAEEGASEDEDASDLTLRERLAELTLEIESHHPVLTQIVNQVTEFLARIGI